MRKILFVIDMQNDFIDESLGTKEAHRNALETMKMCQINVI